MREVFQVPSFSLAHTDNAAIAVAADPRLAVGISIASVSGRGAGFRAAGGQQQSSIADAADADVVAVGGQQLLQRFRCVKEAVAKALGWGRLPTGDSSKAPRIAWGEDVWRSIVIYGFDIQTGEVKVSLREGIKGEFPEPGSTMPDGAGSIRVYTAQEKEYIIAIAVIMKQESESGIQKSE